VYEYKRIAVLRLQGTVDWLQRNVLVLSKCGDSKYSVANVGPKKVDSRLEAFLHNPTRLIRAGRPTVRSLLYQVEHNRVVRVLRAVLRFLVFAPAGAFD